MNDITLEDYERFRLFLEQSSGISLGGDKRYLVSSRLRRLLEEYAISGVGQLVDRLNSGQDRDLRERVIDAMTTNETLWFRDVHPFEIFKQVILPELALRQKHTLRIWSAACSSGQEPYSLSMALQEYLWSKPGGLPLGAEILATDISASMLKEAQSGVYEAASLARGLSSERQQRFFEPQGQGLRRAKNEIRARVQFKEWNLKQSFGALGKFDVIFCRNVLIYFSNELKQDILRRFAAALQPYGYLVLGSSESVAGCTDLFDMVRIEPAVVYRPKIK
ncbi:MAG: protein-glutamate O-methyltransferase CheR [Gammaproteobacteria bacterium]|nr:protein-glutamate O-methyltransferase CheR [Gammaproteobacteria bacterium]